MTNVELLPQEKEELNAAFQASLTLPKKDFHFEVWDGAKLFTLYLQYPLLELWLNDGFETAQLQHYKNAFKNNLKETNESASTLSNFFVSRDNEIDQLRLFSQGDNTVMLITGEAGIGKTRVVIEFYKKSLDENNDWEPLVLVNRSVDFDKLKKALSGKNNCFILVDDAHTYPPETIADINTLCELMNGKVKLILTARSLEADFPVRLIKEYDQDKIVKMSLEELSRPETKDLLKRELGGHPLFDYIDELTPITHGKPILIMALIRAARNGIQIAKIREEKFLNQYVTNYFDSLTSSIIQDSGSSKLKVQKLLQTICLIEPFNYTNTVNIEKLSTLCGLEAETVRLTLTKLLETGISTGRYDHAIRPDYYSDILLMKADLTVIADQLQHLTDYLGNVIINLSSVDEVTKQENSVLDTILGVYIGGIDDPEKNILDHNQIAATIASIAYLKPKIAADAIDRFVKALENKNHIIAIEVDQYKDYHYQSHHSLVGNIKSILHDLLYHPSYYDFVFNNLVELNNIIPQGKFASTVLHFAKRDYIEKFRLKRQSSVIINFKKRLSKLSETEKVFAIECCKLFLQLDFTATGGDGADRNSIMITTYFIPETVTVRKFRLRAIALLIDIFNAEGDESTQLAALIQILDTPRGIFATKRNSTQYIGDAEIDQVLDFLVGISEGLPIVFQKEVLDKMFWYKKWGIDQQFEGKLLTIQGYLAPRSLTEEIVHLLTKSEVGFMPADEVKLVNSSIEILKNADPVELADSIGELLKGNQNRIHFLYSFVRVLEKEFLEKAKAVYTRWWTMKSPAFYQFASSILQRIYLIDKQKVFFWNAARELLETDSAEVDNVILRVYGHYEFPDDQLEETDIELIKSIAEKQNKINHFDLLHALLPVLKFDPVTGMPLAIRFLSRCSQPEAEIFFVFLGERNASRYKIIKTLVLEHSLRFAIGYEIERALNKVVKEEGALPIFGYFKNRFEFKRKLLAATKSILNYEWVPTSDHSHLFDGADEMIRKEFFDLALDWYIVSTFEPIEHYFAKNILEYANNSKVLSSDKSIQFETLADRFLNDRHQFERLLEVLEIFKVKNSVLLDLIIKLYNEAYVVYGAVEENFKEIRYRCYDALTAMGVKSGTAGLPFQVDIDLRDLLKERLITIEEFDPAFKFITSVVKSVEKEIESSDERNKNLW